MYSGELEVQAKRKAIAVLQDEINRILNAARSLSALPELIVKKDKNEINENYGREILDIRTDRLIGRGS